MIFKACLLKGFAHSINPVSYVPLKYDRYVSLHRHVPSLSAENSV